MQQQLLALFILAIFAHTACAGNLPPATVIIDNDTSSNLTLYYSMAAWPGCVFGQHPPQVMQPGEKASFTVLCSSDTMTGFGYTAVYYAGMPSAHPDAECFSFSTTPMLYNDCESSYIYCQPLLPEKDYRNNPCRCNYVLDTSCGWFNYDVLHTIRNTGNPSCECNHSL
ncbi:hypothetical protein [Medusavirus stheno T3]|uniref:Uncharacterized protein n=1 Tax=Medusavirus stheno T3 TaxID=3069717 RepID=A0A7S8BDI4_9VIRU|nr:hypothetical protein QKU73_gp249 [Acanthamoeba castellanii medusavirus]QPB44526.1 hypothetical protein [Medusavirus stheno T3]